MDRPVSGVALVTMPAGNIILVTGGASGIGLAIVQAALEKGWHVVIGDVDAANRDRTEERLHAFRERTVWEHLDVTDEQAVIRTIHRCESKIGPLTGIVNSAGAGCDTPCLDTTTPVFRRMLEVNLLGSFVVAREAARVMATRRRGAIVNIASVSGLRGNSGRVAYGASKGGVISMTQIMAVELASVGIRVNAIAPGPIETPLVREMHSAASRKLWTERVPFGRYGLPEEVAGAAIFLLDDCQSSFVTGQVLCVDGGFTSAGVIGP